MGFRIDREVLLIGKEAKGFSKDYFYEWSDGLGGSKSQLFLSLHVRGDDIPAAEIGDAFFEVMKNYFFHDLSRDPGARFEDMLKELNHTLRQKEEELDRSLVTSFHVIAAAVVDNMLYLTHRGHGEAYLIRKRFVSTLTEGLSDPRANQELFTNMTSGGLAEGDSVLLCSSRLLRYITKSDLGRLMTDEPRLERALEAIADSVSIDLMEQIHVIGVHVGEKEIVESSGEGYAMEDDVAVTPAGRGMFKLDRFVSAVKVHLGRFIPQRPVVTSEPSEMDDSSSDQEAASSQSGPSSRLADSISSKMPPGVVNVLHEWRAMKRDRILILLVVVVVILLIGIYVVRDSGQKQQYMDDLEAMLDQVETNISTAQTVGAYDKSSAKTLLDESEELAMEVLNSGYLRGKANQYLTEIDDRRDELDKVTRVSDPTVFVDLAADYPEINALGIVPLGDNLFVYEYDTLYELILDEIQAPVTIDPDEVVVDAAYYDDEESLIFLTKSNRVLEYADGQVSFMDTDDGAWHSSVDLEIYNNRVYLLDPTQSQVWRYFRQRGGFSEADEYVIDGTDLSDATSLAIDGAVYVLDSEGEILQFISGELNEEFTIQRPPTADLSAATLLYTEFEMFQVFILDPSESRVLVYHKDSRTGDLVYDRQYVIEGESQLRDLYVDKESSRMYLLSPTRIYEVAY